jgi:hypothetical protein
VEIPVALSSLDLGRMNKGIPGLRGVETLSNSKTQYAFWPGILLFQFTEFQPVPEVCRKMGISEATFYNWKKRYGGLGFLV